MSKLKLNIGVGLFIGILLLIWCFSEEIELAWYSHLVSADIDKDS